MELVSIIMPAYNSELYITDAIESVLAQTYINWQLLIIDDCSKDKTLTIIQQFEKKDKRIQIFQTPQNSGAGSARNLGIANAKGRYIAFLDSDDWWYPTKLQTQLDFMQKNGYEFTCTWYESADSNLVPYHTYHPHDKQSLKYMTYGDDVGTPGVMIDTIRIGKIYMPDTYRGEDWSLWLRILHHVDYLYTCPFVSFKYRHNSISVSQNKWKMAKAILNVYNQELQYSNLRAFCAFLFGFCPRSIFRKIIKYIHKYK